MRGRFTVELEIENVLLGIARDLTHFNDIEDGIGKRAEVFHSRVQVGFRNAGAGGRVGIDGEGFRFPIGSHVVPGGGISRVNAVILVIWIRGIGVVGLQSVIRIHDIFIKCRYGSGDSG